MRHPSIVEVYDYGNDSSGAYYTMELLEGGDLRERSPLPWQEACALGYDVCSSLALLHSRQLLHRDISPRNVRTTRDGCAKLIDFGAMVPMGASGQVVGTPPFVPPEVLHRSTLDARTDLFSFGATLYFALTARLAYPARDFAALHEVWLQRPIAPSAIVPGIPDALDALVLSLLSLDPATRPRTAFDVMQRLCGIAGIERAESTDVSRAYLSTPMMVGREQPLATLRQHIARALVGRGSSVLIGGASGVGRTRMLDTCALEAKIAGAVVLRVNAAAQSAEALGAGQSLAQQLVDALPELALSSAHHKRVANVLFDNADLEQDAIANGARPQLKQLTGRSGDRPVIQSALTAWLMQMGASHPLAILIDDLQRVDEASLALLAALVLAAPSRRLFLLASAETGARAAAADAFAVWKRDCLQIELPALSREHTEALLRSVFGDVPNLALVGDRLYRAAAGNPRETLDLVQQLIDRGALRYEGGQWLLPGRLAPSELPSSGAEACRLRVRELSPLAKLLGQTHALASHPTLTRQDYALLAGAASAQALDTAITELLAQRALRSDEGAYVLARREWSDALLAELEADARGERHRLLADLYARDEALGLERVQQLLLGHRDAPALELLGTLLASKANDSHGLLSLTRMNAEGVAAVLDRALTSAERRGLAPAATAEIRRSLFSISIVTDEAHYLRAAPAWFAQLRHDSGLDDYERIHDAPDSGTRLMRALTAAGERYAATPEAERVYSPEIAIRSLAYYVAISIAIGSRTQDCALIAGLPAVLEPFAPLAPLLHALWQNSIATRETICDNRPELAHKRWRDVDAVLATVTVAEMNYVAALRGAIAYGIGLVEERLGFATAEERVRALDGDPFQHVSAMSLRRVASLHKGDPEAAERFRKKAELMSLQANQRQMFTSTLPAELIAHALSADLTGIRESAEAIAPLAARFAGWSGYRHLAEGYFEQARGQLEAAANAFERGVAVSEPDANDPTRCSGAWPRLEAAYLETLVSLERASEAKARGDRVLARCAELGIDASAFAIRRALGLAQAKLGDYDGACARIEGVIASLKALDIRGLELGASYEARARVAIWFSDSAAIERFGRLTAEEYRYGEGSPLGARYDRLMLEARSSGVIVLPELSDFHTRLTTAAGWNSVPPTAALIRDR
ncbi:MAG TPA: AAA family ATPase, partial [Polyangiales bacterium]|nr:AAA family ATPase [Polyangiales bacterium]